MGLKNFLTSFRTDSKNTKQNKNTKHRSDGMYNVNTGLGTKHDRVNQTQVTRGQKMQYTELEGLYRSDGLSKKIIDLIPDEMTREWIDIEGDSDKIILSRMEELEIQSKIREALVWSRLYGGSLVIIGADDGQELDEPLNLDKIKSIEFLSVYDRTSVQFMYSDLYQDPRDKKYGEPEFYTITPPQTGIPFKVHETRVLRFNGELLPRRLRSEYDGWGMPVLEPIFREITQNFGVSSSISSLLEDFVQSVIKIDNLSGRVSTREGEQEVIDRLMTLDYGRQSARMIMLDKDHEEYEKVSVNVAGLAELVKKFQLKLSAVSGIPYIMLMGDSPSGLQSSGQSDIRMFYDMISNQQESKLKPKLEYLVRTMMRAQDGGTGGKELEDWHIEFKPLWQLDDQEQADYRYKVAQTDAIYLDRNVLSPEEVADSRFGGEMYSNETTLASDNVDLAATTASEEEENV